MTGCHEDECAGGRLDWARISVVLMLAVSMFGVACTHVPTRPARQMEQGETVGWGYVNLKPERLLPKFQAQLLYGFGDGDVGVHAGTASLFDYNAGVSGRLYLGPLVNFSLTTDFGIYPVIGPPENRIFWGAGTARLTTSTTDSRRIYGGIQATGTALTRDVRTFTPMLTPGAILGVEIPSGKNLAYLELMIVPYRRPVLGGTYESVFYVDSPVGQSLLASQLNFGLAVESPFADL